MNMQCIIYNYYRKLGNSKTALRSCVCARTRRSGSRGGPRGHAPPNRWIIMLRNLLKVGANALGPCIKDLFFWFSTFYEIIAPPLNPRSAPAHAHIYLCIFYMHMKMHEC